jgi:hypothetical protein
LNPLTSNDGGSRAVLSNIFESLLQRDPRTLELKPHLALARPEISEDKLTYTFKIRQDAHFQDGRPVTGARYDAIDQGPVPDGYDELLGQMERDGWIARDKDTSGPYEMRRFKPLVAWNPDDFSDDEEISAVHEVTERWRHGKASDLVAAAHEDPPWVLVWRNGRSRGQPIPYGLVARRGEPLQKLKAEARGPLSVSDLVRLWRE